MWERQTRKGATSLSGKEAGGARVSLPLAEEGQTGAVTLQSKLCPQPTSKGEGSRKINTAQQSHIVQLSNEQKIKFLDRFPLPTPGSK